VFPMIGFSITSPKRSTAEMWEFAYYNIAPRLYRLPGVAETRIVGGRPREFHVIVDPEKLNGYGFPLTKVVEAIRRNNLIAPAGMVQENYHLYLTTVTGLMTEKEEIANTVLDMVKGTPIRIKDLASVEDGEQPIYNIVTANGLPAVLVNVLQQPDGNAVEIADAVNQELRSLKKELPPDIEMAPFYDQSLLVRDSIASVRDSILLGLALCILVMLGFLKDWRTTLVAAVVIPVAVLIAVVIMKLFKMSFNLMTLGGIAVSIGVVIDDAIVMVENILVHLSLGQKPREAALSAVTELTPALIGSTLTPIVVFVPLVFLGGLTAVFFRALALTLVAALAASLFLALAFTPVLAGVLLKARRLVVTASAEEGASAMDRVHAAEQAGEGRIFRALAGKHATALHWCLAHPRVVIVASVAIALGSVLLYHNIGSGFLPELDEGAFVLDYRMPAGTSLEETDRVLKHIQKFIGETPEIESYSRRTGARLALAIAEPNTGDFLVKLKPRRDRTTEEVTDELREKITRSEPAIEVEFAHILEDLIGDLSWAPQPIQIEVFNEDPRISKEVARKVSEWLPKVKGVVDVVNRDIVIGPAVQFRVDKEKAQRAGFTVDDIAQIASAIVDGEVASNVIKGEKQIGIRVRYPLEYRRTTDKLKTLLITSPAGTTVPLSSVVDAEVDEGQTEIRRDNLRPVVAVTARLSGRDLGSAVDEIRSRLPREISVPFGTDIEYGGMYQVQRESFLGLLEVLLTSVLLIFIILMFEFRSFSHPIAILVATVLCSFGALLALRITGASFNICSFMGAIMVVGLVIKNGILMLDSEQHFSGLGMPLEDAIFEAGRRRLRPILMTALATIAGMLPLALAIGQGSQVLRPLAIAVIGGLAVSMVLSLLVTPVLFCLLREKGL